MVNALFFNEIFLSFNGWQDIRIDGTPIKAKEHCYCQNWNLIISVNDVMRRNFIK